MKVRVEILTDDGSVLVSESLAFGRSGVDGVAFTDSDLQNLAKNLLWHWSDEVDFIFDQKRQDYLDQRSGNF